MKDISQTKAAARGKAWGRDLAQVAVEIEHEHRGGEDVLCTLLTLTLPCLRKLHGASFATCFETAACQEIRRLFPDFRQTSIH